MYKEQDDRNPTAFENFIGMECICLQKTKTASSSATTILVNILIIFLKVKNITLIFTAVGPWSFNFVENFQTNHKNNLKNFLSFKLHILFYLKAFSWVQCVFCLSSCMADSFPQAKRKGNYPEKLPLLMRQPQVCRESL